MNSLKHSDNFLGENLFSTNFADRCRYIPNYNRWKCFASTDIHQLMAEVPSAHRAFLHVSLFI